jgi:hypothetical protein
MAMTEVSSAKVAVMESGEVGRSPVNRGYSKASFHDRKITYLCLHKLVFRR